VYHRHFPDERALGLACSGLYAERNPPPDPERWRALGGEERLRVGLSELYAYFERNQAMFAQVTHDAEVDELTRELSQLRFGAQMGAIHEVLAESLARRREALATLDLALEFRTWQRLNRSGLSAGEAAETMARALDCL